MTIPTAIGSVDAAAASAEPRPILTSADGLTVANLICHPPIDLDQIAAARMPRPAEPPLSHRVDLSLPPSRTRMRHLRSMQTFPRPSHPDAVE